MTEEESASKQRRFHVLVVDDDRAIRDLLHALLSSQGYRVSAVGGGKQAIAFAREERVDLVLLDVMMPGVDGIEVCQTLRREHADAHLPVVFMSLLDDRESRVRAKEAGADDFLVKPIDSLELLVRVENLLRVRAASELMEREYRQLETQLERAAQQLVHLERLSTLGSLAAGVGHELSMLSNAHASAVARLVQLVSRDNDEAHKELLVLERLAGKYRDHARHLLELGGADRDAPQTIDLGQTVAESIALMRASGRLNKVQLALDLPTTRTFVRIGRTELEQVIFNLVINAIDAVEGLVTREPRVVVRVEPSDSFDRARIHVTDNGVGIPPESLGKIFQPYFTTKSVDRGTGLGLSLVQHIVENSDGRVVVVSRVNQGTTASVDFPCSEVSARRSTPWQTVSRVTSG